MRIAILMLLSVPVCTTAQQPITTATDAPTRPVRECVACHTAQTKFQSGTSMAHAAETIAECGVLRSHPLLKSRLGDYDYRIERRGSQSFYTVSDTTGSLTLPIKYAFGLGEAGQTYILEKDGEFFESFVSYYKALNGLDITMGDQLLHPGNLKEAAGRRIGIHEIQVCFGCHTTNAFHDGALDESKLVPGVQCEHCHGPSENHLAGLKSGNAQLFKMPSIKNMTAEESTNFCGQCHRTWEYVAEHGPHNISNVRFQPYRLTNSKCFDVDDKRISCVACHNPHENINRTATSYDAKCQACHAGGKPEAKVCKVATSACTTCHMPKLELPGSHHKFTDHNIRIALKDEPYPQ
jgi:nitrate reductase cytochrome c-type subunit